MGGGAALLLLRGNRDIASLLLEVERVIPEYDRENESRDIWLEVRPEAILRFSGATDKIRETLVEFANRKGYGIDWVGIREILPDIGPDWREQLRERLDGKRPTNQGRRARVDAPRHVDDGLSFTNAGELKVYRALKRIQEQDLRNDETIGIFPLAGGRVLGRTWEPDLIVTYKGRAGVLEIDGPYHNQRRAMDVTRDHIFRDSGVAFIDRIPVEAVDDDGELMGALRRFLRRLGETR